MITPAIGNAGAFFGFEMSLHKHFFNAQKWAQWVKCNKAYHQNQA
jgi:hypothetical protein